MRKWVKKCCAVLAAAVMTASMFQMVAFAETLPATGVVTATDVNVRTGPSTDTEIISVAQYGYILDVYERHGNWYKIGIGDGKSAYICADYVSLRGEDIEAARSGSVNGQRVVEIAKRYLGTPYVYGGSSPSGFDCSGFTSYVYAQMGYSINRTANAQLANGTPVSKDQLKPGDLVLFKRSGSSTVHHVGIYVGGGQMIHSPNTGSVVRYESIASGYYNDCYYAGRRIVR